MYLTKIHFKIFKYLLKNENGKTKKTTIDKNIVLNTVIITIDFCTFSSEQKISKNNLIKNKVNILTILTLIM